MKVEFEYLNSLMGHVIDECIHSERDRALMKRRYIDGIMICELVDEFNLSEQGVRRVIDKHKSKVFKAYKKLNKE